MKKFLSRCLRRIALWAVAALVLVQAASVAFAQEEAEAVTEESWSLSYVLVFLCIALGLVAVCRPGRRLKEIRVTED